MKSERRASVRRPRRQALSVALVALAGLAAGGACSSTSPPSIRGSSGTGEPLATSEPIADGALRLVAPHAWLVSTLSPNALGWTAEGGRFLSPGWRAADVRDTAGVGARYATTADRPMDIGVGQDPTRTVILTPTGAGHVDATLDRGRVVFHDAYPSTDVVVGATRERVEELLILRSASAPSVFAWTMALPSRLPSARIAANGSLEIVDAHGRPALVMPRPFAVDAHGQRRDASLAFDGTTLQVGLDTTGLAFPVALDPAMEAPLWTLAASSGPTPYRDRPEFAFDATHHVAVLFGGQAALNDTWLWNGATSTWTSSCTTCAPPARSYGAMAFDATRGVAVMFGGVESGTYANDLWEWNGSTWTQGCTGACQTGGPAIRNSTAMTFAGSQGVLMFGGHNATTGNLQDTWTWSGTAWTQQCTTAGCMASRPTARTFHALAYDSTRSKVVLFGGLTTTEQNDTWEWNGTAWTQVCMAAPCNAALPPARQRHSLTYDSVRGKTVLFGGSDVSGNTLGDTWEWDGATWTNTVANTAAAPGGRYDAGFAFDATNRECVLFSGEASTTDTETWVYTTHGESCSTGATCDSNVCTDGVCCESACTNECYPCDGTAPGVSPGVCAPTGAANAQTTGCTGTSYCNGSSVCVAQGANGAPCTANIACQSGACDTAEGVCCNSACAADGCHSCLASLNGGTAGQCLPITAGTTARSGCAATSQSTCGLDGTCNGTGACRDWPAATVCVHESCSGTTQTNSATCTGSGACNAPTTTACGTGFTCGATACNASCTPGTDAGCQSGYYCVGGTSCVPKLANGTICSAGDQCSAGNCNHDGVCCDQACNGVCQSCTNAKKGSGPDGTCGGTAANTVDPSGTCTNSGTTCGAQPLCDGTNSGTASCVQHAHAGTVCGATTCTANAQSGQQCDGAGNCASANNVACAPYDCADGTMCATTCAMDSDCQTGGYCSGAHTCIAKQANGQMCGSAHECTSGLCVDGFCCNGACGEQCQACNVMGKEGTCSPVTGAPVGTRPACTNAGMAPCGGACNGTNGAACTFAGSTTTCGNACSGAGNTEETTSSCNGQGACVAGEPAACPNNLLCDTTTKLCKTTCTSNADCAPNYDCDPASHLCAAMTGAVCDGMHTINSPMEEPQDCTPYICSAMGCLTKCASPTDCVAPNICDESDHCNLPQSTNDTSSGGSSGGCAMATATPEETRGASYVCALLGVVAIAARRRRKPASPR